MGQAWSTFLVPGLPSCQGGAWPMLSAARNGDNRHLQEYTHQEPLLLLACTVKGAGLAHMAAEAGRLDTLRLLVQLVGQYGPRLAARVQEVLSWSDSGLETLKSLRSKEQQYMCQLLHPEQMLEALFSWQDVKGVTPLMLAARGGHAECLSLLLEHGANPLLLDSVNKRSCLHYAAGAGHARCVNILLNEFVTVLQPSGPVQQQLRRQPQRRQRLVLLAEAEIQDSVSGRTSFVDLRTVTGFSALHYATFWGFAGCVKALLTAGASVDQPVLNPSRQHSELPVANGSSPLHLAADYGHVAIAALLLQAHVLRMARSHPQPTNNNSSSRRPDTVLPWEGVSGLDPRLRRNGAADTPLMLAESRCNSSEVIRTLLDPYVPINRILPTILEAFFGGPPRFGVPQLAVLAKTALDQHLTGTLKEVEEQQQQLAAQQRSASLRLQQECVHMLRDMQADCPGPLLQATVGSSPGFLQLGEDEGEEFVELGGAGGGMFDSSGSSHHDGGSGGGGIDGDRSSSNTSSIGTTPAASRSTSYGSISSLGSSSSICGAITRAGSEASSVAGVCSPCSPPSLCSSLSPLLAAACALGGSSSSDIASSSNIASSGADATKHCCGSHNNTSRCGGGSGGHVRSVSIASTIAESIGVPSSASSFDRTCAICFDGRADVEMVGCSHCVCASCARSLLERTSVSRPALCPFCRTGLSGWRLAPISTA